MSKAASENELSVLHSLLAEHMKNLLESGEASTADLSAVRQFLKDNGITADPESKQMKALTEDLPDFEDYDNVTAL